MLKWLWVSVVVIAFDQITKLLASAQLVMHQPLPVLPSFNLTLMHNSGAAFSFLSQAGGWQRWFFVAIAFVVSVVLIIWLRQLQRHQTWLALALALILGGALGNVWDRIMYGYVVDFVDLYYGAWHWPAFNVADSAITVGAILLLLDALRGERKV